MKELEQLWYEFLDAAEYADKETVTTVALLLWIRSKELVGSEQSKSDLLRGVAEKLMDIADRKGDSQVDRKGDSQDVQGDTMNGLLDFARQLDSF